MLGCVGVVGHLVFMTVYTEFFTEMDQTLEVWADVVLVTAGCFLIPFGLVHGIAWVVRGFRQQPKDREEGGKESNFTKPQ